MPAHEVARELGVAWTATTGPGAITGVTIDSRAVQPGDLFVALQGDRVDGRAFIPAALAAGASAVVAEPNGPYPAQVLTVASARGALATIAGMVRRRFHGPVVAVGGSAGKTTTKEILRTLLSARFSTVASEKSFNNDLGVPLTMCRVEAHTEVLVAEIGTNHPGEVAPLAALARPTIAILTSIGEEHLEGFGSIAGVLAEEMALIHALPPGGVAVVNGDDPHIANIVWPTHIKVVRCGFGARALDVRAEAIEHAGGVAIRLADGGPELRTGLVAGFFRINLLLAAVVARMLGCTDDQLAAAAQSVRPAPLRGECRTMGTATVIVDCYNANPLSAGAALADLASRPGRRAAVLGDMLEMGSAAAAAHEELGRIARAAGLSAVVYVGAHGADFSRGFGDAAPVTLRRDARSAETAVAHLIAAGGTILVKASRGIALENALGNAAGVPHA